MTCTRVWLADTLTRRTTACCAGPPGRITPPNCTDGGTAAMTPLLPSCSYGPVQQVAGASQSAALCLTVASQPRGRLTVVRERMQQRLPR